MGTEGQQQLRRLGRGLAGGAAGRSAARRGRAGADRVRRRRDRPDPRTGSRYRSTRTRRRHCPKASPTRCPDACTSSARTGCCAAMRPTRPSSRSCSGTRPPPPCGPTHPTASTTPARHRRRSRSPTTTAAPQQLLRSALEAADTVVAPSSPFYIAAPAGPQGTGFRLALAAGRAGGYTRYSSGQRTVLVLGHSDYHYAHEDVLYGWKPGPGRPGRGRHRGSRWQGDNRQSSLFFFDRPARSTPASHDQTGRVDRGAACGTAAAAARLCSIRSPARGRR